MQDRYERDAEHFLEGLNREYYLADAGLKETLAIAPLYDEYGWLFGREAVDGLLRGRQDRTSRYLADFAAQGYLDDSVKALTEEATNAKIQAKVEWDGQEIPYRSAAVVLANEPDSGRRHELNQRLAERTAESNPQLLRRLRRLHLEAGALGFADYVALCDDLGGLNLLWLGERMAELLERTGPVHYRRLENMLAGIGVARESADNSDLAFLFRAPQFDALFPKDRLLYTLGQTLGGLGIDIDRQPNVELDVSERPLKSPRAFCATIRVPEEIKLVIMPHGGQDDYHALLHEAGHAEHFAHTAADLDFAFRHLGDNSVTEGYAMLLDELPRSPRWLAEVLGVAKPEAFLRLINFRKLYMLRRYAAKLAYELRLHRSDGAGLAEVYAQTLGGNLGLQIKPENYLNDLDDAFYVARYIRAWIFEVQLRRALEARFGQSWFASRAAGRFLTDLWREGQKYSADELAQRLGYAGLDPQPLIEELIA
ncbi:MAG: hypothetical protein M1401_09200 [Chloroflexi bacterium]|nr:hypothetical protein [Chloroflexota bacterium]